MDNLEPSEYELRAIAHLEDLGYEVGEICELLDTMDIEEILELES